MKEIIFLVLYVLLAIGIAKLIGTKRHIGFFWTVFLSLLLTPGVGLILALLSPKNSEPYQRPSTSLVFVGRMMIVLFGAMFLFVILGFGENYISNRLFGSLFSLGLFGLGVYLVKIGKCNFEGA